MKKITLIIVLTLASVTALSSRAQEPLLKIEQVMTPQEMQQTGVLTLSSQERDALNRWLVNYTLRVVSAAQAANQQQPPKSQLGDRVTSNCSPAIESTISGRVSWL